MSLPAKYQAKQHPDVDSEGVDLQELNQAHATESGVYITSFQLARCSILLRSRHRRRLRRVFSRPLLAGSVYN